MNKFATIKRFSFETKKSKHTLNTNLRWLDIIEPESDLQRFTQMLQRNAYSIHGISAEHIQTMIEKRLGLRVVCPFNRLPGEVLSFCNYVDIGIGSEMAHELIEHFVYDAVDSFRCYILSHGYDHDYVRISEVCVEIMKDNDRHAYRILAQFKVVEENIDRYREGESRTATEILLREQERRHIEWRRGR